MVAQLGRVEDVVDALEWCQSAGTGLVVDDTNKVSAVLIINHHVKTVDATAKRGVHAERANGVGLHDILFQSEDGEGCELAVERQQLAQVLDNHLAVDELQTVEL